MNRFIFHPHPPSGGGGPPPWFIFPPYRGQNLYEQENRKARDHTLAKGQRKTADGKTSMQREGGQRQETTETGQNIRKQEEWHGSVPLGRDAQTTHRKKLISNENITICTSICGELPKLCARFRFKTPLIVCQFGSFWESLWGHFGCQVEARGRPGGRLKRSPT